MLLYIILRLVTYQRFRSLNEVSIRALAQENSNFIESARAIQSIKLFNRETTARACGSTCTPTR